MLRKLSRSQQKSQHITQLMSDSHSDIFVSEHKNKSFFNIPRLFLGFYRKGSESDSLSSPTSTLDFGALSSFANPLKFQRSSNDGSQKAWDCSKVGLSIIGSLDDDLEQMDKTPLRYGSKSIIFGPQMRIRVDSFETPLYQDLFGDSHSCSPDSGKLACSNSNSSSVFELSAKEVGSKCAPVASISAIEIKRSEDYTCVKTHSPYPKVTHIFADCILEWHKTDFSKNGEKEIELPSSDFLSFCYHCKKVLDGEDIYIYRGNKAFCSCSFRSEEISIEEERTSNDEDSEKTNFGEEFSNNGLFIAI